MPPRCCTRDARALRCERRIQTLTLGVKGLQHRQAFGQSFDVIRFGNGHGDLLRFINLRDIRTDKTIIAQILNPMLSEKQYIA